jgi:hypothetical protein
MSAPILKAFVLCDEITELWYDGEWLLDRRFQVV